MNRLRSGFTLIELLVVIFIIVTMGILLINSLIAAMKKKDENKGEVKTEVKVEKPFSRFVVQVQELEVNDKQPSRLVCIQDTKTGQEWLAVQYYGLTLISSSATQSVELRKSKEKKYTKLEEQMFQD